MMLSRSGLYAVQAAMHMAQQPRSLPVSASTMAERLSLPPGYLAKVLQRMSRDGVVRASRGPGGGYRLTRPPQTVSVEEVVASVEETSAQPSVCLMGGHCDLASPCTAHAYQLRWAEARRNLLGRTTIAELLGGRGAPTSLES